MLNEYDCSKLTVGFISEDCDDITAIPGTGSDIILISYSDILKSMSTFSSTDKNVIESIVLKEGAKGYQVSSLPNATVGEDTLNVGTYNNTHQHNLTVRIFKKSEAAKKFVNNLTQARVVAIVQNNDTGEAGETKYEVYGWDSGLRMLELTASTEMPDGVAYLIGLQSDTIAQERTLPKSFWADDEATTDGLIEALLTAAATPTP